MEAPDSKTSIQPKQSSNEDPPWWYVLCGTILLGFSGYIYHYFSEFEAHGGTRRINWFLALAYEIGGKWLVSGVFAACALGLYFLGYAEYRKRKTV